MAVTGMQNDMDQRAANHRLVDLHQVGPIVELGQLTAKVEADGGCRHQRQQRREPRASTHNVCGEPPHGNANRQAMQDNRERQRRVCTAGIHGG